MRQREQLAQEFPLSLVGSMIDVKLTRHTVNMARNRETRELSTKTMGVKFRIEWLLWFCANNGRQEMRILCLWGRA